MHYYVSCPYPEGNIVGIIPDNEELSRVNSHVCLFTSQLLRSVVAWGDCWGLWRSGCGALCCFHILLVHLLKPEIKMPSKYSDKKKFWSVAKDCM